MYASFFRLFGISTGGKTSCHRWKISILLATATLLTIVREDSRSQARVYAPCHCFRAARAAFQFSRNFSRHH